jgi:hypothetical protein
MSAGDVPAVCDTPYRKLAFGQRRKLALILVALSIAAGTHVEPALAQQEPPAAETPQPLTPELRAELEGLLNEIDQKRQDAARLLARAQTAAKTENYWTVYWDITRAVKLRFDEEGISIPFPQRDVHLIQKSVAATSLEADRSRQKIG